MTPTTAEVLEALDVALSCLEMSDVDLEHYQRNPALAGLLRAHRDRLERDRDALRKVRDEMAVAANMFHTWERAKRPYDAAEIIAKQVAALDAILAEEP